MKNFNDTNPTVKYISLNSYEKYYLEALNPQASNNVIYYHVGDYELTISFGWDLFINIVKIPYSKIIEIMPVESAEKDIEVTANKDLKGHPSVIKFIEHYTHSRGIPEE